MYKIRKCITISMIVLTFTVYTSFLLASKGSAQSGEVILIEESFEDTNFESRGWYDAPSGTLSTDSVHGNYSLECRFIQGGRGCADGTPRRHLFNESEEVYLSYYVKYSANWQGSNKPYHLHEFHFITNVDHAYIGPAGTHLTTYIEQVEGVPRLALQDALNVDTDCILLNNNNFVGCNGSFDSYVFTEDRSIASCNGIIGGYDERDCYSTGGGNYYSARGWSAGSVYFLDNEGPYYKNDWHHIETYFKMNTISDGIGQVDGQIRYWYDGQLLFSYDDILFRTGAHPDMKFNQFLITPYIGDGSPIDQIFWIDNLIVATSKPNPVITGDLNGDGEVDIQDVQACVNHILERQDWEGAADVNEDGRVDVSDVQGIINSILGE